MVKAMAPGIAIRERYLHFIGLGYFSPFVRGIMVMRFEESPPYDEIKSKFDSLQSCVSLYFHILERACSPEQYSSIGDIKFADVCNEGKILFTRLHLSTIGIDLEHVIQMHAELPDNLPDHVTRCRITRPDGTEEYVSYIANLYRITSKALRGFWGTHGPHHNPDQAVVFELGARIPPGLTLQGAISDPYRERLLLDPTVKAIEDLYLDLRPILPWASPPIFRYVRTSENLETVFDISPDLSQLNKEIRTKHNKYRKVLQRLRRAIDHAISSIRESGENRWIPVLEYTSVGDEQRDWKIESAALDEFTRLVLAAAKVYPEETLDGKECDHRDSEDSIEEPGNQSSTSITGTIPHFTNTYLTDVESPISEQAEDQENEGRHSGIEEDLKPFMEPTEDGNGDYYGDSELKKVGMVKRGNMAWVCLHVLESQASREALGPDRESLKISDFAKEVDKLRASYREQLEQAARGHKIKDHSGKGRGLSCEESAAGFNLKPHQPKSRKESYASLPSQEIIKKAQAVIRNSADDKKKAKQWRKRWIHWGPESVFFGLRT